MDGSPTATITDSPTTSPTTAPVQASHKSTNAGAIGGGVAAGVVVLLLVAGLLFWRRRRARSHDGPGMAMGAVADDGSRDPSSSDSSLTESGKIAASGGSGSHYTPHSQMAQLNNNGSEYCARWFRCYVVNECCRWYHYSVIFDGLGLGQPS